MLGLSWIHNENYIYMVYTSKTFPQFPPSSSNMLHARQRMTEPFCVIKYHVICKSVSNRVWLESFITATVNSWCELAGRLLLQLKLFSFYWLPQIYIHDDCKTSCPFHVAYWYLADRLQENRELHHNSAPKNFYLELQAIKASLV